MRFLSTVIIAMNKEHKDQSRYSIGEWFGQRFDLLSGSVRRAWARDLYCERRCPFQPDRMCSKRGGVCSLRRFNKDRNGSVTSTGSPVTTCPNRFLEANLVFDWVGEVLLNSSDPVVLPEIGFLEKVRRTDKEWKNDRAIGRIDHVLLHPERIPLDWCALEMQAVYFSGKNMNAEFKLIREHNEETLPFPAEFRRPDWRSSGPKRLLPQLQTKTPTIRTWGKKVAVVIDEPFYESLTGMETESHLSNAEIVWFVVGYEPHDGSWKLCRKCVIPTRLDASVKALTGGVPLSKEKFERQLVDKLKRINPQHPLSEFR